MTRRLLWSTLALAFAACFFACNAGDVTVFSTLQAGASGAAGSASGSAGSAGSSGAADLAGGAGSGGSSSAGVAGSGDLGGTSGGPGAGGMSGAAGSGAEGGASGTPCHESNECPQLWLCNKRKCSDALGTCEARPAVPDPTRLPVCGCDNVNYWNDSLRKSYGICASTPGECPTAHTCNADSECGPAANCAYLLSPTVMCGGKPDVGICWVTPDECPTTDKVDKQICPPPGASGPGPCVTFCQAIQSGHPAARLPPGATCH